MLEFFKFIFSSGWVFLGFIIILYALAEYIIAPICNTIIKVQAIRKVNNAESVSEVKSSDK